MNPMVKKLRSRPRGPDIPSWAELMFEAADELERVQAELDALKSRETPGYAGVLVWSGGKKVVQVVSSHEIDYERIGGWALTLAAQRCLLAMQEGSDG